MAQEFRVFHTIAASCPLLDGCYVTLARVLTEIEDVSLTNAQKVLNAFIDVAQSVIEIFLVREYPGRSTGQDVRILSDTFDGRYRKRR